jgi:hypothetical protein
MQSFITVRVKYTHQKFYDRHPELVDRYAIYLSQITHDLFKLS